MPKDRLLQNLVGDSPGKETLAGTLSFARLFTKWGGRYAILAVKPHNYQNFHKKGMMHIPVLCQDVRVVSGHVSILVTPIYGDGAMWVLDKKLTPVDEFPPEILKPKTKMYYDLTECKPGHIEDQSV